MEIKRALKPCLAMLAKFQCVATHPFSLWRKSLRGITNSPPAQRVSYQWLSAVPMQEIHSCISGESHIPKKVKLLFRKIPKAYQNKL